MSKLGLGLGCLRAVAHDCNYNYNYNKIELGNDFQKNLKQIVIQLGWGLDGRARWRKVTITIRMKLNWGVIFKII